MSPEPAASFLHRAPAPFKLFVALSLVIACALLPARFADFLAIPAGLVVLLVLLARLNAWQFFLRLLRVEFIALGIAALAFFQPNGHRVAALLLARSTACLMVMVLLASTTPLSEILAVLRALRFPRLLLLTLSLMARYMHLLSDESLRMRRAARPHFHGAIPLVNSCRADCDALLRALDRATRIHHAMLARGGEE